MRVAQLNAEPVGVTGILHLGSKTKILSCNELLKGEGATKKHSPNAEKESVGTVVQATAPCAYWAAIQQPNKDSKGGFYG
jgi:hypothetical protein